jgi:dual specificity tyrosine-phosphorylation-regulated kinase 2/3/4
VYYIGVGAGPGEDDLEGSYLWRKHEQVGYRYELLECLGSGAFGEVVKGFDHKSKEIVAIKIIKSRKEHMQLALNEINILMRTKERDIENEKNIVRIKDFIVFRKHICIVTELLSISLYELMQLNRFQSI